MSYIVHVMSQILKTVAIKCGYDVMDSAYDGIHMPPVMSCIVGVIGSKEWVS